jgi:hypothetical protein
MAHSSITDAQRRASGLIACSCAVLLGGPLLAQAGGTPPQEPKPDPAQQQQQPQQPQPAVPAPQPAQTPTPQPTPPPPSDADRAAEALRKAFGLKKGPTPGDPNAPKPAATTQQPNANAANAAQDPNAAAQDPQKPPQDPTEQAASSLRDLMPKAVRPQDAEPTPLPEPQPAPREADLAAAERASQPSYPVHGSIGTRLRSRSAGNGDDDLDLGATLQVNAGDKKRHATTAHFAGRAFADLDNFQRDSSFNGLDETIDDDFGGYVYAAHADLHRIPNLEVARIGRQSIVDGPQWLDFDGAAVETKRFTSARIFAGAYVGAPVRYWESTSHGDRAYGGSLGAQMWEGGRARFDWMHIDDDLYAVDGTDDLVSLQAWHALSENANLYGKHTWLDGDPRDLVLRGQGYFEKLGLDGSITYRELLSTQRAQTTDFDPYSPIFVTYAPYRQLELLATKQLSERWTLAAGCDVRELRDEGTESSFNREYARFWAGPTVERLFDKDLTLSVQAENWESTGGDYSTFSGDLRWRATPLTTATIGTSYARFAYDAFAAEERDNVRSWYVRLQHRPRPSLRVESTLAHEDNDYDSYVHFRIGTTWTF